MTELRTELCRRIGIDAPVMQAGMSLIARPKLVAAVSAAGGLGVLGGGHSGPDELREEIHAIKAMTDRPFGVDLLFASAITDQADGLRARAEAMIAGLDDCQREDIADVIALLAPDRIDEQVQVCIDEGVRVLVSALGSPGRWIPALHDAEVVVLALAGSFRQAERLVAQGVDAVIASGTEGGGHTGRVASLPLWNACVRQLPVPIVAAGGVADGRSLAAALVLGCEAAWLGTRFALVRESPVHERTKRHLLGLTTDDVVVTRAFTGKTLRVARNDYVRRWEGHDGEVEPFPLQMIAAAGRHSSGLLGGDLSEGALGAGQVVGVIDDIPSAADVIRHMVDEAAEALASPPGVRSSTR